MYAEAMGMLEEAIGVQGEAFGSQARRQTMASGRQLRAYVK